MSGCFLKSTGFTGFLGTLRSALSDGGYTLMRQSMGHLEDLCGISTAPCILQSLVRRCLCLRSTVSPFFWEMTSGCAVYSALLGSTVDTWYLLSVYEDVGYFTYFYVKVDSDPAVRSLCPSTPAFTDEEVAALVVDYSGVAGFAG